jgi:hypothetical protein
VGRGAGAAEGNKGARGGAARSAAAAVRRRGPPETLLVVVSCRRRAINPFFLHHPRCAFLLLCVFL